MASPAEQALDEAQTHVTEASAELAALVDQNQRFIEWHLEQGRMLTDLRARLERAERIERAAKPFQKFMEE